VLEINLDLLILNLKNKITEALKMLQIHLQEDKKLFKESSSTIICHCNCFLLCSDHRSL